MLSFFHFASIVCVVYIVNSIKLWDVYQLVALWPAADGAI